MLLIFLCPPDASAQTSKHGAPPRGAALGAVPTADAPLGGICDRIAAIGCLRVRLEEAHSVEDASYCVCGRNDFSNERHPRRKKGTFEHKLQPLISQVADVGGFWTLEALSRTISLRTQLKEAWAHVPTFKAHIKNLTGRPPGRVSRRHHLTLTPCEYMRRPGCRVDRHSSEMPKRSVWDGTFIVEMNRRLGWAHE